VSKLESEEYRTITIRLFYFCAFQTADWFISDLASFFSNLFQNIGHHTRHGGRCCGY
jgi:hypothetical protein